MIEPTHVAIYHTFANHTRPLHQFTVRMGQGDLFQESIQYHNEPHRRIYVEPIDESFKKPIVAWLGKTREEDTKTPPGHAFSGRMHMDEYTAEKYNQNVGNKLNQFASHAPKGSRIALTTDIYPRTRLMNEEPAPIKRLTPEHDYVKGTPGWGAYLEAKCLRHLERQGVTHVSTYIRPSQIRAKTLNAAGLETHRPIPIREWIDKLEAYAEHKKRPTIRTRGKLIWTRVKYGIKNALNRLTA